MHSASYGIKKDLQIDKSCGPDIKHKLANIINKRFSSVLQQKTIKEKQEKYDRSNNCTKLIVPECNKVIKEILRPGIIARDRLFQCIQLAITKATYALIVLASSFLGQNSSLDVKDIVTTMTDTIALLRHAHVQLSYRHRDAMIPALKGSYGSLSSTDVPITDMLFGGDVIKTMGEVKKAKSVQYDAKSYTYPKSKKLQRPQGVANEISAVPQQRKAS